MARFATEDFRGEDEGDRTANFSVDDGDEVTGLNGEPGFFENFAAKGGGDGFARADFASGKGPETVTGALLDEEDFAFAIGDESEGSNLTHEKKVPRIA